MKAWTSSLQAPWNEVKVDDHMLYLGAMLGPGGKDAFWRTPLGRFQSALATLCSMGMAWPSATSWYGTAIQSLLTYHASMQDISSEVMNAERLACTKILNIPHQSIPHNSLASSSAIGLSSGIRSIEYLGMASKCRVFMKSDCFPRVVEEIAVLQESDEVIFCRPHKQWLEDSVIGAIDRAHEAVHRLDPPHFDAYSNHLQAMIFKFVVGCFPPSSPTTLSTRLATTFEFQVSGSELNELCQLLVSTMKEIPRFVQPAFYRSCHNAWNTSSRYGEATKKCRWCGVVDGDSLLHYLICPLMLKAMLRMVPILFSCWCRWDSPPCWATLLPGALGIGLPSPAWLQLVVIWHDFLHHCHALSREHPLPDGMWESAFKARRRVWHRFSPKTSTRLDQFLNRF